MSTKAETTMLVKLAVKARLRNSFHRTMAELTLGRSDEDKEQMTRVGIGVAQAWSEQLFGECFPSEQDDWDDLTGDWNTEGSAA
jgi:hypothetical protein